MNPTSTGNGALSAGYPIQIIPVCGIPEIQPADDLVSLISSCIRHQNLPVMQGDIFVVAQKIVSKAEARTVSLETIVPSRKALDWAARWGKDARIVELVLRESKTILRMERGIIISETHHGFICANAGVDASNAGESSAILLPVDPDASARRLQLGLEGHCKVPIGVIVSDTFGRAWREGLVNVALGVSGLAPLIDYRGKRDGDGKLLNATIIAAADEIASAAELVMGKADHIPVAIIRGFMPGEPSGSGRDLIRPAERDLFR